MSDVVFFLNSKGIANDRIVSRYIWVVRRVHEFVTMKKITKHVRVDYSMIRTAVYDYFIDVARLKEFHVIEHINREKITGYIAYWLLRRKPIQVVSPFPGSSFINELFVTALVFQSILSEKKLSSEQCQGNTAFGEFQSLLFHYLKYRPVTQQSLELMMEAFFCGCDF